MTPLSFILHSIEFFVVILLMYALHVVGTAQWNPKSPQFPIRNWGVPDAILKWRIRISTSLKRLEKCLFGQFELLLYHWDRDSVLYFRIRQIHEDWWRLSLLFVCALYFKYSSLRQFTFKYFGFKKHASTIKSMHFCCYWIIKRYGM